MSKRRNFAPLLALATIATATTGCALEHSQTVDAPQPLAGEGFHVLSTMRTDRTHAVSITAGPSGVYVANPSRGTITRLSPGSPDSPRLLVADESAPTSVVVDEAAVYFLDQRSLGQVVSITVDGGDKRVLSTAGTVDSAPLTTDDAHIYWAPSHGSELLAIGKDAQGGVKTVGSFADDAVGACAVRHIASVGTLVYGIAVCTKDRVASSQLVSLDLATGTRRVIDSVSGSMHGLAVDGASVYYSLVELSAQAGEIRKAPVGSTTHMTLVANVPVHASGVATDASLDKVYYAVGSQILAAPKTGGAPAAVATIGSLAPDAAIVVQQLAVSKGAVFARVGELDGTDSMKHHVIALEP